VSSNLRAICWAFTIDYQHFYSGHKKFHAKEFQPKIALGRIVSKLAGVLEGLVRD
jgi:hypothetical protein